MPHLSRRAFTAAAVALPSGLRALAQSTHRWIFLGTDKGKGIFRAPWNSTSGTLGRIALAAETPRPDFFAMHPVLPVLYTVNSVAGDAAAVTSFRVDTATGLLTLQSSRQTHGAGPCAVSIDATGQMAFAANYSAGSMTAFQLGPAGELAQTIGVFRYTQATHGPVSDRQEAAHLHCVTLSPDNRFVLVCDLGDDVILAFKISPGATSSIAQPVQIPARAGSGPRHVAFHPNGRWLYCIHELDCTVDLYDWNATSSTPSATLRAESIISTLAAGVAPIGDTACEIVITPDGRFAFTCTRGETSNTIVSYRIDSATGLLTFHQRVSSGGKVPRYIAFDPTGRWLVCTNQGAAPDPIGNVTVFAYDPRSGRLSETPATFAADTPMFAQFV